ncbi:HAD family hydrolase [Saccharibacillus alkalitolerans]|uniref:HAD family hydrolase n=1 Tax=Saccharibacillus alkalitolerans TaxID=2705290 RepID=A0ABX0EZT3_9BACL|nr:HAD family hydrolase [Saccharibacillus alkalitolerans]NGZ73727.1 HAD family hydrolase [Saccharibacillus alkalitolerans]
MGELTVEGRTFACEALVFDKDGTLLDFMELWGRWADDMLRQTEHKLLEAGGSWTGGADRTFGVKRGPDGRIADYDRAGPLALATAEEMIGVLAWQLYGAGLPWHESVDAVRNFAASAEERLEQDRPVRPLPGLRELLEQARGAGIRLAVATSDTTDSAVKHLRWAGLEGLFDCISGRDRVREGKPAPDLVLEACRRLGTEPRRTIVIGDGGSDMEMARRAGAALAIGIAPGGGPRGHLDAADYVIAGYDELAVSAQTSAD